MAIRRGRATGAEAVLLLEDDVVFAPDILEKLDDMDLPEDWGMFFLGARHLQRPVPIGKGLVRVTEAADNHALLIRREYIGQVIKGLSGGKHGDPREILYSDVKLAQLQRQIPTYAAYPNLAWQAVSFSENGQRVQSHYRGDGTQISPELPIMGLREEMQVFETPERAKEPREAPEPETDTPPRWDAWAEAPRRHHLETTYPLRFYLNLGRRGDRRQLTTHQFAVQELTVQRFAAVDAREVERLRGHKGKGQYGCAVSHRLMLREAKRRGAPAVLLFEDDVVLHPDFRRLAEAIDLPEDWGLFYYGCQHIGEPEVISPGIVRVTRGLSTHAYAVRAPYYDMVMKAMRCGVEDSGVRECDVALTHLQKIIPTYGVFPNLAWQGPGASDIVGELRKPYQDNGVQSWNLKNLRKANAAMLELRRHKATLLPAINQGGELPRWLSCAVCGWSGWFQPFGNPSRPNARCSRCHALERHRALALWFNQTGSPLHRRARILHFAPEACLQNFFRARATARYVTADLHAENADRREDITALTFRDGEFDFILCSHVLEHVCDDRQAMREMHRVLVPGGVVVIMLPLREGTPTFENVAIVTEEERLVHFGQKDHVRWYGMDVTERLESTGFHVEVVHIARRLGERKTAENGLIDEPIFVCRRQLEAGRT